MIEVRNLALPLSTFEGDVDAALLHAAAKRLGVDVSHVASVKLLKRSVDARKKHNVHFVVSLGVTLAGDDAAAEAAASKGGSGPATAEAVLVDRLATSDVVPATPPQVPPVIHLEREPRERPIVVGTGPAGLFAALHLARAGAKPIVLERGGAVDERIRAVNAFIRERRLDENSNIQFGEGGAGTFSDGKLTTNTKDPRMRSVLETLVEAGAPEEILWQAKPHVGTDHLASAVKHLREQIIELGGEVRFKTRLVDLLLDGDTLCGVVIEGERGREELKAETLVLATGHSARDTFEMLHVRGAGLVRKPFSIGVRVEHSQAMIDRAQYGQAARHPALGAAEYKLSHHLPNGRGVYTFCMCPGGWVVAATSEQGGVVTNGMSRFAREGANANAAWLVSVMPEDFGSEHPLAGVEFQRKWERAAYQLGGREFKAPGQLMGDFLAAQASSGSGAVEPTYPIGVTWTNLAECLPAFVVESLRGAAPQFERKLKGFTTPDAVLTGVETRSSSPVRVIRDESLQSNLRGVYPCGEGAGYAGGIMSAAVDGLRVAEALLMCLG